MTEWIGLALDALLIIAISVGIMQAIRLIRQLQDLRASRADMDRFVRDFNSAVMRAEAGIKGLRAAARESGDDLEKLVQKAIMVRDELNFIVESADGVAERLSVSASNALHAEPKSQAHAPEAKPMAEPKNRAVPPQAPAAPAQAEAQPSSRAEKELLQALKKLS